MRVDIQKLLAAAGSVHSFDVVFPVAVLDGVDTAKARAEGDVTNHGGYLTLEAAVTVSGVGTCARCLAAVPFEKRFSVKRPVAKALTAGEDDDYILADEDGFIYLQPVFEEELVLQFPSRLLCGEGCKGLCPKCGKNLNGGPCGCDMREIDPRLEALRALLD